MSSLLTTNQAAEYCGMRRDELIRLCRRREIESTRDAAGCVRISTDEIDSYMAWGPPILGDHMGVYFIQCGQRGPFKIGHTDSTKRRIAEAQTFSPWALQLRAIIHGRGKDLEKEVHRICADSWMRGEWFEASDLVVALVRDVRTWAMPTSSPRDVDDCVEDPVVTEEVRRMADICLGRQEKRVR